MYRVLLRARPTVRGMAAMTTRRLKVRGRFLGLKRSFNFGFTNFMVEVIFVFVKEAV